MRARSGIKKNLFFSIFNQLIILCLGIVLPRLILVSYGSEVNGLVLTVTQIFTYVALLEAGIGNASINALYKPITDGDNDSISEVICATKKYYRKITLIYSACVIALAFLYPVFAITELSYTTVALVIVFQGLSGVINFSFSAAYQQFLIADGKNYVVSTILLISYVLSSLAKILLMCNGFSIVFIQVAYFGVSCVQAYLFIMWIKRKYPELREVKSPRLELLAQRNAFIIHEVSGTIFSSTDVFVLSTFCNLKIVSVYAIYNMVFVALNQLISSVSNGLNYLFGHTYAKDRDSYEKLHDAYEGLYMGLVFSLFTVAYVLIIPFVRIYTRNITDIQYVDYRLPILFVMIQLMSCGRAVSSRLITISGHAKKTQVRSIVEAVINLTTSIVLVNFIGIFGVLLGTNIALLYRMNDIIIYANRKILKRSPWKTYKVLLSYFIAFVCFLVMEYYLRNKLVFINDYISFFISGVVLSVISLGVYFSLSIVMNKEVYYLFKKVIKRLDRKGCNKGVSLFRIRKQEGQ